MPSSINKVILVGRLGADPELRYTPGGNAVCKMSLATNLVYLDKDKQRQERVNWHKVVTWGRQGEVCKQYLTKGQQVYVEGRIENRSYTDKTGVKRYVTDVVSDAVVFLSRRGEHGEGSDSGSVPAFGQATIEETPPSESDEMPF
jgi:single-strand DNA-binding protein